MTSKPLRCQAIAVSAVVLMLLPSLLRAESPSSTDPQHSADARQDLEAGRAAASECLTLMDHDADELLDCIEYRAAQQARPAARLAVLWYGWLIADIHDAHGLDGADRAARRLFRAAEAQRLQLDIDTTALCALVSMPCSSQQARWHARAAEARQ